MAPMRSHFGCANRGNLIKDLEGFGLSHNKLRQKAAWTRICQCVQSW